MKIAKSFLFLFFSGVFTLSLITCTKDVSNDTFNSSMSDINNQLITRDGQLIDAGCFVPGDSCDHRHIDSMIISFPFYYNDSLLLCDSVFASYTCDVYECEDSIITFDNFNVLAFWGCDSLTNLINNLYQSGNYNEIARIQEMIEYQASLVFEKRYIENLFYSGGYNYPGFYFETHFYRLLCYQTCFEYDVTPSKKIGKTGKFSKVICGNKCCKRTRNYYQDHHVLKVSEPRFEEVGDGKCDMTPQNECNGLLIGDCNRTCGMP